MKGRTQDRLLIGVICIIAAAVLWLRPAQAGRAYLATVGAPPLRFQTVMTNYFVFNPKLFAPTNLVATTSNVVNQADATNEVAIITPQPMASETITAVSQPAAIEPQFPLRRYNFNFAAASASDLLTVTPQMITPYLRPDVNPTNALDRPGAIVFVPAQMQFTPPPSTAGESRTTYSSP